MELFNWGGSYTTGDKAEANTNITNQTDSNFSMLNVSLKKKTHQATNLFILTIFQVYGNLLFSYHFISMS